jgi:hypothetical protein
VGVRREIPVPDDIDDDIYEDEEDAMSSALFEADIGDRLHICRGMPFCDGSPGHSRVVDGELTFGCAFCYVHRKRGDETIYELMAGASNIIVH